MKNSIFTRLVLGRTAHRMPNFMRDPLDYNWQIILVLTGYNLRYHVYSLTFSAMA